MKLMRWLNAIVAVAIVALALAARGPSILWAANGTCGNVACGSGFNGSYHDFVNGPGKSSHGTVNLNGTNTSVGQCTLCHTPHKALLTTLLWNHHLSNNTQFTWEANATTMAGTPYATIANNWAGPTSKCLSCHDGSVSPSTINWYQDQTPIPGAGSTCTTTNGITTCGGNAYTIVGGGGSMMSTHPVAMPYPCGGVGSTYNSVTTGQQIVSAEWVAQPSLPIRLYQETGGVVTRAASGGCATGSAGVECTSCHDVHNRENIDIDLLRGAVSGSANYICQECHNK